MSHSLERLWRSLVSIHNRSELFLGGGEVRWGGMTVDQRPYAAQNQTVNKDSAWCFRQPQVLL